MGDIDHRENMHEASGIASRSRSTWASGYKMHIDIKSVERSVPLCNCSRSSTSGTMQNVMMSGDMDIPGHAP